MSEWISVEDRLPEECTNVLIISYFYDKKKPMQISRLYEGRWLNNDCISDKVTHWMPLPEPPEGEQI